ncbi:hypothetical protein A9Q99_23845 [Gammaproteobacteria bacterium 45_16_T64]|nr:hypothetical protein A9Q99_23845 [Gammaproteobacteria bacterium 45_16_T64]
MAILSKISCLLFKMAKLSRINTKPNIALTFMSFTLLIVSTNSFANHIPKPTQQMVPLVQSCQTPGLVALTFDDGPSDNFTRVLSILDSHNVKATFFLVGKKLEKQNYIELAQQAITDGHQIENHSWDHSDFLTLSDAQITEQVSKTNEILWNTLRVIPRFVRPPHGRIDVPEAMPIWNLGYGIALWNLDPRDYKSTLFWGPQQVFERIEDALEPSSPATDSFVILMHDFSATSTDKLSDIIILIKQHGYTLATLDECVINSEEDSH